MENVYIININNISKKDVELVKTHLPLRYQKACSLIDKKAFNQKIAAGILLLKCFDNLNENDIYYNEYNKPYIKDNDYFNISSSNDLVVLVKSKTEVGIDIEYIDKSKLSITKRVFNEKEQEWIKENPLDRFFILWCQKESVMKVLGLGFKLNINSFDTLKFNEFKPINVNNEILYNNTIKYNNYYISLTSKAKIEGISFIEDYI